MTTSNAAVDPKVAKAAKAPEEKQGEKLAEKRRALGRGLESLLPGPRVVPNPTLPQTARNDAAPVADGASAQVAAPDSLMPSADSPHSQSAPGVESVHTLATSEALLGAASGVVDGIQASGWMGGTEPVMELAIDQIDQNPHQTRRDFDEAALKELANSIRVQGVLQPVVVRPVEDRPTQEGRQETRFKLILGERRLRASRLAGIETVPAIVKRVTEQQAAEMTLVENLQRQDLNCVEQADAFKNLSQNFDLTQEEIGVRVGLSREAVSNYMRLLTLPEGVIGALQQGQLTYSHARLLLQVKDRAKLWSLAQKVMEEKLSVAGLEDLIFGSGVRTPSGYGQASEGGGARWVDPNVKAAQRSLEEVLGMRVRIRDRKGRGKIVIEYATLDDFDRVVGMLKGK
jgi:ParB family transcriptional regulator, chromosome partitioning protein